MSLLAQWHLYFTRNSQSYSLHHFMSLLWNWKPLRNIRSIIIIYVGRCGPFGNWKYKILPIWKSNKSQRDTETDTLLHLSAALLLFSGYFLCSCKCPRLGIQRERERAKTEMRNSFHCQWPEDNIATWKHDHKKYFYTKRKKRMIWRMVIII